MIKSLDSLLLEDKLRSVRRERYACQSVARKALPKERVSKCLRSVGNMSQVEVWKHLKTDKSFYNGLLVCGSIWTCPICAAKISERRKGELQTAFDQHKKEGGKIALLTLTFSHKKNDRLKETLKKFTGASARFRSGKRWNNIRLEMGLIGSIRVFEITYGGNGFHPHIHLALFYTNDIVIAKIKYQMYQLWEIACNKFGLNTSEMYGLDLQDGEKAQEYLSKHGSWSLEQELSKSHIKVAKFESMTPFDFLRTYLLSEDNQYLDLFKEYAHALKGKSQIYWSRGLKARFVLEEKTDEELASEKIEEAELLGLLTYEQWKFILKEDKRAKFLDMVEKLGFETAYDLLKTKKDRNQWVTI